MFPSVPGKMIGMEAEEPLKRLGRLVVQRRQELGWATRQAFADDIDLTYRVLTDLETGKRPLSAKSYAQLEKHLGWSAASILHILEGGDPEERQTVIVTRVNHEWDPGEYDRVADAVQKVDTDVYTLREVESVLGQLGWEPVQIEGPYQPDLLVQRGDRIIAIDVRQSRQKTHERKNDELDSTPIEGASDEGRPPQKTEDAADLIPEDQDSGVEPKQSDYDLVHRRGGGESETRRIRREQDEAAERGDE